MTYSYLIKLYVIVEKRATENIDNRLFFEKENSRRKHQEEKE